MDNRPIGIFDSGVGGLSVLREIHSLLPNETTLYVADQERAPYGKKPKEKLIERADKIMQFFISKNVKAVVIACNTATIYTVDEMRGKFKVPVIGTVPVVKVLSKATKTGKTAVFSTPGTAKSEYLQNLISKFASNIDVEIVGGSNLEELIEKGDLNSPYVQEVLEHHLKPLVEKDVDAIALGCTHYPFLKDQIQKIVGENVLVVDSGGAVARQTHRILEQNSALAVQKEADWYYTTGDAQQFRDVAEGLLHQKLQNVESITL